MVEIVKQLGWTYVSTVAAQGEYGEKVTNLINYYYHYICYIFPLITKIKLAS